MFVRLIGKFFSVRELSSRTIIAALALCSFSGELFAGQVNLAWDASASTTLTGYKVYYGNNSGSYSASVTLGKVTSYTLSGLTDGTTYYMAVTAYDSTGQESAYSNEVFAAVPGVAATPTPTPVAIATPTPNPTATATPTPKPTATPTPTPTPTPLPNTLADFTVSAPSLAVGQIETLTPVTKTAVTSWSWTYGDGSALVSGNNSVIPVATKSYNKAGTYTVSLTANGVAKSSSIKVSPVASFTASATSGATPLAINFTDSSLGSPSSWSWTFGDGTTSTMQNPSHSYGAVGSYTVSLTVTGGGITSANTATQTIVVSTPSATPTPTPAPTTVGLVAAYTLDEGAGSKLADASGKGNTGTLTNSPTWTTGKYGKALGFGGSKYVTVPNSSSVDIAGKGLTLSLYANITNTGSDQVLIGKPWNSSFSYPHYQYGVEFTASSQSFTLYLGDTGGSVHTYSMPATLGVWTHIAFTYDGTNVKGYVNGVLKFTTASTFSIPAKGLPLRIGLDALGGQPTNGALDEIRLYNSALSGTAIAANVTTAVTVSNPPKYLLGQQTTGSVLYPLPMGVARAFQTTAAKTGLITSLPIYVDSTSTSSTLKVGVYSDNGGHPGTRLATTRVSNTAVGKWNIISLAATSATAGGKYWVAILSPQATANPIINLREISGVSSTVIETSAQTTLTSLPSTWTTGTQVYDGPLSLYGAGY